MSAKKDSDLAGGHYREWHGLATVAISPVCVPAVSRMTSCDAPAAFGWSNAPVVHGEFVPLKAKMGTAVDPVWRNAILPGPKLTPSQASTWVIPT
jgi:hypothetical protein